MQVNFALKFQANAEKTAKKSHWKFLLTLYAKISDTHSVQIRLCTISFERYSIRKAGATTTDDTGVACDRPLGVALSPPADSCQHGVGRTKFDAIRSGISLLTSVHALLASLQYYESSNG